MDEFDDDASNPEELQVPALPDYKFWWCFQITPHNDEITKEQILEFFDSAVIGEEEASNRHFHIVFGSNQDLSSQKLRSKVLYKPLHELMDTPLEERKIGNKYFRWDKELVGNYAPYSLKDGNFISTNDMKDISQYWYQISYPKPLGLKKELKNAVEKFINNEDKYPKDVESLWKECCRIYSFYDRPYNYTKINDTVRSVCNKKYPEFIELAWEGNKKYFT